MIAVDTNVLVRFLVNDDHQQAQAAKMLLDSLSDRRPGFVCREVAVELAWVLKRSYGFSGNQIADIFEELVGSEHLVMENATDVVYAARQLRMDSVDFSDLMVAAAAARFEALPVFTFDKRAARNKGFELL